MDTYISKAKEIIAENIYMTVSTASLDGEPWVSPVFFAYDEAYNFFWVSNKDSNHSKLIRTNPRVAIVIFDSQAPEGKGDGVYVSASVVELSQESDIQHAIEIFNSRVKQDEFKVKKISDVTGSGVWRMYKAIPSTISKLTEGEFIGGQYVDRRIEIKL